MKGLDVHLKLVLAAEAKEYPYNLKLMLNRTRHSTVHSFVFHEILLERIPLSRI